MISTITQTQMKKIGMINHPMKRTIRRVSLSMRPQQALQHFQVRFAS
jgi:hypothetical protein